MLKVALKDILARKRRLVTTSIAIVLGIAFLTGTNLLSATLQRLDRGSDQATSTTASTRSSAHRTSRRRPSASRSDLRSPSSWWTRSQRSRASASPRGSSSRPGPADRRRRQGLRRRVRAARRSSTTGSRTTSCALDVSSRAGGRRADDEIALDFTQRRQPGAGRRRRGRIGHDPEPGDPVVRAGRHPRTGRGGRPVVGRQADVLHHRDGDGAGRSSPPEFNFVAVGAAEGETQAELADRIAAAVPGQQVVTGEAFTEESQEQIAQFVDILGDLRERVRLHRTVRRDLHHLQHVLDHHHPAHPGDGAAASGRRPPPPGARGDDARSRHRRPGRRDHRPACSACCWQPCSSSAVGNFFTVGERDPRPDGGSGGGRGGRSVSW